MRVIQRGDHFSLHGLVLCRGQLQIHSLAYRSAKSLEPIFAGLDAEPFHELVVYCGQVRSCNGAHGHFADGVPNWRWRGRVYSVRRRDFAPGVVVNDVCVVLGCRIGCRFGLGCDIRGRRCGLNRIGRDGTMVGSIVVMTVIMVMIVIVVVVIVVVVAIAVVGRKRNRKYARLAHHGTK